MYKGKNWVQALILVELAVNSAVLNSTILSVAHVTFGQPLHMPVDECDHLWMTVMTVTPVTTWMVFTLYRLCRIKY